MTDIAAHKVSGLAIVIATTSLGFVVVQVDASIVNVALARIGEALGASVDALQWVIDAYALSFASLLLLAGALGDRYGARRTFVTGMAMFTVASLACGLAPNVSALIAARALQGAGAALVMPCSLALLNHACGDDRQARARAIGLWTAAGGAAISAGVVLGGVMVQGLGWPSIFLVNLPIGCLGIWLCGRFLEETPTTAPETSFDWPGQALAILALLALTGAVIEAGALGWTAPAVTLGLGTAAVAALAFVWTEMRSSAPLLPLGLFRRPAFSVAVLVGLAVNLTVYGSVFVLSFYFQKVRQYSPAGTGLALLPFMGLVVIANVWGGRVTARHGTRLPMIVGLAIGAMGFAAIVNVDAGSSYLSFIWRLALIPIGIGLAVPAMTMALLSSVPKSQSGLASGVLNTVRQAAGAIGVALFGSLMQTGLVTGMQTAFLISALLLALAAGSVLLGIRRA
jgi:DHA2 family methylenomycin A resistance protein-like MFS transporter